MEDIIKGCFYCDYGVPDLKSWTEGDRVYIAIPEDEFWWKNKCCLQDSYFNYFRFKECAPGWTIDCHQYGTFVFWKFK